MTATVRTASIAAIAGIAGFALGALAATQFMGFFLDYGTNVASLATIAVEGPAMEKMTAGDIDAARRVLDIRIDGELMSLGAAVDDGFKLPPEGVAAIARIKRMRELTGYAPPDPAVRKSVEAALALGNESE